MSVRLLLLLLAALFVFSRVQVSYAQDDAEVEDDEDEVDAHPGFSDEEWAAKVAGEEDHVFDAEVGRLMDIIINSLYSNRDIFLRELISNSADALDKIRYQALTDPEILGEGDQAELEIRISFDKDSRSIKIRDRGIGMTKEDLGKCLGSLGKSGTTDFSEAAEADGSADNLSLIGQFGVGFYSAYLVAERITVVSKHNDDPVQHIWESTADASYTIAKDPRGDTLGRGTEITLHLREDAEEFLNPTQLKDIVTRYSQFVNYPIYLLTSKEVSEEVELPEDEDDVADLDAELGIEIDEDFEYIPRTEKVTYDEWTWERVNDVKAIWTRSPSDITEEEYNGFFKSITHTRDDNKKDEDPLTRIHFSAEGEITFRSILYVPYTADAKLYDNYYEKGTALKLYVRRVLITDEFDEFLPRYLSFVRGVVDSDDLPLNVSRETLAQNRVLKVMSKKLTRKVLEMLKKMADAEIDAMEDDDDDEDDDEGKAVEKKKGDYTHFWEEFGKSIKLGIIDDRANKSKLSKLLRYKTSKSEGEWISLEDYVDDMADDQRHIYYITGESYEALEKSPFLEQANKKDYEVIFMVDPLDEYITQHLTDFDGNPLQSVTKEGLKMGNDDIDVKKYEEAFEEFSEYLEDILGKRVTKVAIATRLDTTPCIIVTSQYGWTANMERIMKAQTFNANTDNSYMAAQKTLEINPRHPIIVGLKEDFEANGETDTNRDLIELLYDAALVQSGFEFGDPLLFGARINRILGQAVNKDPDGELIDHVFTDDNDDDHEEL